MNIKNADLYLRRGWTYGLITSGSMSLRRLPEKAVFGHKGPAVFSTGINEFALAAYLNSNLATYFLRQIAPSFSFETGSVLSLPWAETLDSPELRMFGKLATELGQRRCQTRILETEFIPSRLPRSAREIAEDRGDLCLLILQALIEKTVAVGLGLRQEDLTEVQSEVGVPVAFLPGVQLNGNEVGELASLKHAKPEALFDWVEGVLRSVPCEHSPTELTDKLRSCFESGFTGETESSPEENSDEDEGAETIQERGSFVPPAESFIEEISRRLSENPILIQGILGKNAVGWHCRSEEVQLSQNRFTVLVLRLLGHRWPKQIEAGEDLPAWADPDGVIPLAAGGGETPLIDRVRERLAADFPGGNVAALQQEFAEIVSVSLEQWLAGPFFERHISQFKKRPIAWQIETEARALVAEGKGKKKKGLKSAPVFSCLVYYHKLDADLLPKIRTQYVGTLRSGFETKLRNLERQIILTPEQQTRRLQLDAWIEEMKAFDAKLEQVSVRGFGPESMQSALRQYAIADALLSLMACWLKKLNGVVDTGPLKGWLETADKTNLHADISKWVGNAFQRLDHFCAAVGPKTPEESSFVTDPTSSDLAPLVCAKSDKTVSNVLELACERWWRHLDEEVLDSLKSQLKQKKEEMDPIKEELKLDEVRKDYERAKKLADRLDELKRETKALREEIDEKTETARQLRKKIESWTCAEAATWEKWLGTQPMFDTVASLDGQRPPPQTIAEFITQESRYAPDINDGVRVNIAPLQKAGLLHADVLDSKDAEKAIADRAEWRADERRWVREGKLPQPGWWKEPA